MNDKLFNLNNSYPTSSSTKETTLIISAVPSKVAYEIITKNLAEGSSISESEVSKQMAQRTRDGYTYFDYSEVVRFFSQAGIDFTRKELHNTIPSDSQFAIDERDTEITPNPPNRIK